VGKGTLTQYKESIYSECASRGKNAWKIGKNTPLLPSDTTYFIMHINNMTCA